MSAQHRPGYTCEACEGFCLQPVEMVFHAGVEMSFRIGQRVRHRDYKGKRVTGVVTGLMLDSECGLMITAKLDAPIVIPAGDGYAACDIYTQQASAHEFTPFDDRDELIVTLLAALEDAKTGLQWYRDRNPGQSDGSDDEAMARIEAALAKAAGSDS
jgi:hypothetical protein